MTSDRITVEVKVNCWQWLRLNIGYRIAILGFKIAGVPVKIEYVEEGKNE